MSKVWNINIMNINLDKYFKYNYVVDTCVDYQQIQKCSTLRFSKEGFKDS